MHYLLEHAVYGSRGGWFQCLFCEIGVRDYARGDSGIVRSLKLSKVPTINGLQP